MEKGKNGLNIILLVGLLVFIGGLVAFLYNAEKDRELQKKKFQHELILGALDLDNKKEQEIHIKMLFYAGLLEQDFLPEDSIITYLNQRKTLVDKRKAEDKRKAVISIINAMKEFYLIYGRCPKDLSELTTSFRIESSLNNLSNMIHYVAGGPKHFDLRFPGSDGVLYTPDDKKFNVDNLKN